LTDKRFSGRNIDPWNRGSAVFSDGFFRNEFKHLVQVYREKKKGLIKNLFAMRQETCSEPQINK
jgi:hypothetical protein